MQSSFRLEVVKDNVKAISLYKKMGFTDVSYGQMKIDKIQKNNAVYQRIFFVFLFSNVIAIKNGIGFKMTNHL